MAASNRERVGRALDLLRDGLSPYVLRQCLAKLAKPEAEGVARRLLGDAGTKNLADLGKVISHVDLQQVMYVMTDYWREVFHDQLGHPGRSLLSELRDVRNHHAHSKPFNLADAHRAIDSSTRLLEAVSAREAEETRAMGTELLRLKFEAETERAAKKSAAQAPAAPVQGLAPWRDVAQPHPDVQKGEYAQAEFAASLWQVHSGRARDEYSDPREFLLRTFPTEGIRRLARRALERASRRGGEPVVELQTSFGGGKTHSLLVLYHLLGGQVKAGDAETVETLLKDVGLDGAPTARRAVLVGTELNPAEPWRRGDGTEVRTLWGELGWQLGGADGYELVAEADRKAVNPGTQVLADLFELFAPALVLIDEWVVFARTLVDRTDLPAGTFEANQSFAQSLTEAAAAVPDAMVVISLPESDIETGGPAGKRALEHLRHVVRRVEGVWKPATAEESFEIVRRRLFLPVEDSAARNATCRSFTDYYKKHRGDFPSECSEAAYERRMQRAYPIHPELFDRLYSDWSTIERFQRTRGVLRLMAKVIHYLWARGDASPLILPGTVPLDAFDLQSELTQYLPEGWDAVIDTDVDGSNSRPLRLDSHYSNFGKAQAARRVARTVFLGSAPSVAEQQVRGLEQVRVKLGSAFPGDAPALYGDALARLGEELTYLYADGSRFWYDTRANVNRTARDRASQVKAVDVEDRIVELLREKRKRGVFAAVHAALPSGDIPDEQLLRLVMLGPAAEWLPKQESTAAHEAAAEILANRGASPRIWQNTLVFLAPEAARLRELEEAVRHEIAWRSVAEDIRSEELNVDTYQRRQAEGKLAQAKSTVAARLVETWSRVLVPQQTGTEPPTWSVERITSGDGTFEERAGRKLVNQGLVVETLGPDVLLLHLDRNNLWRDGAQVDVRQLWDWCCQYLYMPKLASQDVLLASIQDAAKRFDSPFAYADGYDEAGGRYQGLAFAAQIPAVRADGHSVVVRIQEAERQRAAERPPEPSATATAGSGLDSGPEVYPPAKDGTSEVREPSLRRFHGSVALPALGIGGKAGEIGDEVLRHLAQLAGAELEISLEIQARLPEGASQEVRRVVEENCRTLRFSSFGFEEE